MRVHSDHQPYSKAPISPKPSSLTPRDRIYKHSPTKLTTENVYHPGAESAPPVKGGLEIEALSEIEEVFREKHIPRALRRTIISHITKMEMNIRHMAQGDDRDKLPSPEPRYRQYVGHNGNRFRRQKVPLRKPKDLYNVPRSVMKAQCQTMREEAASVRHRTAMEVYMHIQAKRNSYAMNEEAAARIAADNERMSLLQLKVKNAAMLCSLNALQQGLQRAVTRRKDMEIAAKELQERLEAAAAVIHRWWWCVSANRMRRELLKIVQEKLRSIAANEKIEDVIFLHSMSGRMRNETMALAAWRANQRNRLSATSATFSASGSCNQHDEQIVQLDDREINSVLHASMYRRLEESRESERIDMFRRPYRRCVATTDTYQQAIDRMDKKYNLGIATCQKTKTVMVNKLAAQKVTRNV